MATIDKVNKDDSIPVSYTHLFRAVAELLHWLALSAQRLATWLVR